MGMEEFISEAEAETLTGVSVKTLERFAETGYLSIEKEADGLRLYSTSELENVFGVNHTATPWESEDYTTANGSQIDEQVETKEVEKDNKPETSPEDSAHDEMSIEEEKSEAESYYSMVDETPEANATYAKPMSNEAPHSTKTKTKSQSVNPGPHYLTLEIAKLEKVNEVNEKIIQLREEQLKEVKAERDWLRNQVERLEEKAERDQVLLLSETQLLRQILEQQMTHRSPVRAALEWLGVVEPKPVQRLTGSTVVLDNNS